MADRERDHVTGEPDGHARRPEEEMTSTDRSPTNHDTHDLLLVAAQAAGDVEPRDRARAEFQIARCAECAALRVELATIAAATAHLPRPTRRREYTLSRDDAASLRRPSLRRLLVDLAGPRGIIGRPVATAVTSLGVAGIVLASAGGFLGGAAGAAPSANLSPGGSPVGESFGPAPQGAFDLLATPAPGRMDGTPGALGPEATAAPGRDPGAAVPSPGGTDARNGTPAPGSEAGGADVTGIDAAGSPAPAPEAAPGGGRSAGLLETSAPVVVSITLLLVGLGLFGLRRMAGRLG